jgi:hypothetical protein
VFIKGADALPGGAGWSGCPATGPAIAGIRAKAAGDLSGSSGQFTGSPNSLITPSMDSTTFMQYGGTSYAQLVTRANVTLSGASYAIAPVAVGSVCNQAVTTNWGDGNTHTNPCGSYYPIVHLTAATVTLTGGQGQGMLLVDGNLTISGSFNYYGVVIVRGLLKTTAGSSKIYGSVLAQQINLGSTAFNGDITIQYSTCAILSALQSTSNAQMNRSRGWIQLF